MLHAARRSIGHWFVALGLVLCVACAPAPTRPIVTGIDLRETTGERAVDDSAVLDGLATSDEYDRNVLSRDLERVERYYRARGYYEAKVTASRVLTEDARHVRLEIRVDPGQPVRIGHVLAHGAGDVPVALFAKLSKAQDRLRPTALFDEDRFNAAKQALLELLQNNGYPYAKIDAKANIDLVTHDAEIDLAITPGIFATYGTVQIVGLHSIPERPVRDNLDVNVSPGQPYSRQDLADARRALLNTGVFSSVEIQEDLTHPDRKVIPIQVLLQESQLHTVRLGGGAEFDVLRLNLHLRVGWEHLNFLGGMRDLQINATPGVDLYPTRLDGATPIAPTRPLIENSVQVKLQQPAFLEGRTVGTVEARYDIKPLLYPLTAEDNPKTDRVVGYNTLVTGLSLRRDFPLHLFDKMPGNIALLPSYNWQANFPFTYQGDRPAGLNAVRVAFPGLHTELDVTDDPISPHQGFILANDLEVADRIFGGSVSDFKIRPEIRGYIPITKRRVTLATRLSLGFLFPRDYGDTLKTNTQTGQAASADPTVPNVVFDQEKLLMRAFYSGGANSNRGYPLRGVGPHGPVGFLIPTNANCSLDMPMRSVQDLPATCIRPTGGFTLWEASLELRFPISGPIRMVVFADASDVTRAVGHIRFNVPHLSVGPGLRYTTPVGALRLDIGYRVPGAQQLGQSGLDKDEGGADLGTLFNEPWLPVALNIALGEAF